jgi:hypothetical protein
MKSWIIHKFSRKYFQDYVIWVSNAPQLKVKSGTEEKKINIKKASITGFRNVIAARCLHYKVSLSVFRRRRRQSLRSFLNLFEIPKSYDSTMKMSTTTSCLLSNHWIFYGLNIMLFEQIFNMFFSLLSFFFISKSIFF